MSERKKLNLEINTPTEITLLYSEAINGSSVHGDYHMYSIKSGTEEYVYFAPLEVHQELQNYKKGDSVLITKLAAQRGQKLVQKYVVEPSKNGKDHSKDEAAEVKTIPNGKPNEMEGDGHYQRMLQSYQDAMDLQEELGIPIDVSRIAISIYIGRSK